MMRLLALLVLLTACLTAVPAAADCTDSAGPGVNWRRCLFDGRELHDVDLTGAMLRDAAFGRARMTGANLSQTDAYRAKFISTDLKGAKFIGARLIEADFTRADLAGASFADADLRNAKLVDADLRGADLTGARLHGADLRRTDFSRARWIDGQRLCADNSIGQCN